jgi:hypothetical protein
MNRKLFLCLLCITLFAVSTINAVDDSSDIVFLGQRTPEEIKKREELLEAFSKFEEQLKDKLDFFIFIFIINASSNVCALIALYQNKSKLALSIGIVSTVLFVCYIIFIIYQIQNVRLYL